MQIDIDSIYEIMKQLEWKTKALRQLRKIKDQQTKEIIYDSVDSLSKNIK